MDEFLKKINDIYVDKEKSVKQPTHIQGATFQRERLEKIVEYCCNNFEGDLIEIGAFIGLTTAVLGKVCQKYNRKLIVVDPWEKGTQACDGWEYDQFIKNTESIKDVLIIYRASSIEKNTIEFIKNQTLCFAFVDGLHTPVGVTTDIESVKHCKGIVAVDDIRPWLNDKLTLSFIEHCKKNKYNFILSKNFRESYII